MKKYMLKAKLQNGTTLNLDFLPLTFSHLLEIDQFTNLYDYWGFLKELETYLDKETIDEIDGIYIEVNSKGHFYSVCFQNPYLEGVLKEILSNSVSRVPTQSEAFLEMTNFLFQNLSDRGLSFLKEYRYQNRFIQIVFRYVNNLSESEEDCLERIRLKDEIIKEMSNYHTYRSLCLYRRNLRYLRRPIHSKEQLVKAKESVTYTPFVNSQLGEVSFQYPSVWTNLDGDEREEFLDEEEIRKMVKTYGEF